MGVYFIQAGDGGPVKIGVSYNIWYRREIMQVANAAELKVLGFREHGKIGNERSLHRRFAAHRIRGEWFHPHPDILAMAARYFVEPPPKKSRWRTAAPDDSFRSVIRAWPSTLQFARDIGVAVEVAQGWSRRDKIPGRYWLKVTGAARKRGIDGVTVETLAALSAAKPRACPAEQSAHGAPLTEREAA